MTTQSIPQLPGTWNARNLLTVPEVAEWARVHPKTVYRWIKQGKLEAIQFGPRTFRVPEDAISKFLQKTGRKMRGPVRARESHHERRFDPTGAGMASCA